MKNGLGRNANEAVFLTSPLPIYPLGMRLKGKGDWLC